jgi:hypothetical protein
MSGQSNVIYWLRSRGIEPEPVLVEAIFDECKRSDRLLTESEIQALVSAQASRRATESV